MSMPTVAVVGRPNVGKSTLFNRLLGGRRAIVSDQAGTTRDRHFGTGEWGGRRFWLIDTGGLLPDSNDSMDRAIRRQVDLAVEQSDLVVLLVDGKEGLNPVDAEIAAHLRSANRPVLLAVNKLDDLPDTTAHMAFYKLGLGDPIPLSAAIGKASGDLLDAIVERLPEQQEDELDESINVAVVGRPNVGKSSLINRLLGEDRVVVSPVAGTTRDAVDSVFQAHGKSFTLIDTAGLRKKARVHEDVEFYSTLRTQRAIERAQVCVLVVDAALGLHTQDLRIANEAWDRGCGLVIAVNKWDLVTDKDANTARRGEETLRAKAPFLAYVKFVYLSAETGQRVHQLPREILEVAEARERRIPTAEVNKVLEALVQHTSPPQKAGREVKLLYASQVGTAPPVFAIVCSRPDDVPESYQRYLINGFRKAWSFEGAPLRLKFKHRSGRNP